MTNPDQHALPQEPSAARREEIITLMTAIMRRRSVIGSYSANLAAESIYNEIIAPLLPVQEDELKRLRDALKKIVDYGAINAPYRNVADAIQVAFEALLPVQEAAEDADDIAAAEAALADPVPRISLADLKAELFPVQEAKTVLPEEVETLVKHLRAPAYWLSGSEDQHEGDNEAPLKAAALIEAQQEQIRALQFQVKQCHETFALESDQLGTQIKALRSERDALSRRVEAAETMAEALESVLSNFDGQHPKSAGFYEVYTIQFDVASVERWRSALAAFRKPGETE